MSPPYPFPIPYSSSSLPYPLLLLIPPLSLTYFSFTSYSLPYFSFTSYSPPHLSSLLCHTFSFPFFSSHCFLLSFATLFYHPPVFYHTFYILSSFPYTQSLLLSHLSLFPLLSSYRSLRTYFTLIALDTTITNPQAYLILLLVDHVSLVISLLQPTNTTHLTSYINPTLSGNEIDTTTSMDCDDTRRRSMSEGGYEKKRKYQRKNSISSCAGFSSNNDFGSIDIDSSSGDFEVCLCVCVSGLRGVCVIWWGWVCVCAIGGREWGERGRHCYHLSMQLILLYPHPNIHSLSLRIIYASCPIGGSAQCVIFTEPAHRTHSVPRRQGPYGRCLHTH